MCWLLKKRLNIFLVFMLIAQFFLWYGIYLPDEIIIWKGTRNMMPKLGIVPDVPSETSVNALSLGDGQFYFRTTGLQLQNAGDTFGRSTSLKKYDYSKLYKWWTLLDNLDDKSDFTPSLAGYYFASVPNSPEKISYVVDYLEQHADRNPSKKWLWYTQAAYNAKSKMKDTDRAIAIAQKLTEIPKEATIPMWAREYKAFLLEDIGEYNEACQIILNIIETFEDLSESEQRFLDHFIRERVRAMIDADKAGANINPICKALFKVVEDEKKDTMTEN